MIKINVHIDGAPPFEIAVSDSGEHDDIQAKALAHLNVAEALAGRDHYISELVLITRSRMVLTITTKDCARKIKDGTAAETPADITPTTAVDIIESLRKKIIVRDDAIELLTAVDKDLGDRIHSILEHLARYDKEIDSGKR